MYIYDCTYINEETKARKTSQVCMRKTEKQNVCKKKVEKNIEENPVEHE